MHIAADVKPKLPRPPITSRQRSQLEAFLVLRRNPLELWGALAYERDVIPGRFLGREQLLLNDPAAIRHVLVDNDGNYGRNIGTRRVLRPVLGDGLFLAEGKAWRHQRRTLAPAFTPRTMPILARHVVNACERAEALLTAELDRPVPLLEHLQRLALNVAGQSMFSLEMAEHGGAMRRKLQDYALRFAQPGLFDLLLPPAMRTPLDRGRAQFRAQWLELIDQLIAARAGHTPEPERARDLFDLLAAARDPETGLGFDHAQLRDEIATMILAGHETTAVTLFWSCYVAAFLPEQQERLAEEVRDVDLSPDAAWRSLAQLPLIRAHIDETLRLYPPAFLIVREAKGPDVVAGRQIAPGTVVSISPWVLHRHRRRWADPDAFDAERFAPGTPAPDRFSYMPFGAGPRICIGAQFALTEAAIVLARLLQCFRFELVGSREVQPRGFVTTQPNRQVRFLLTRRRRRVLH